MEGQLAPSSAIISIEHPLDMYYAYGISNSFGIDFDPVTGKLWDTENGSALGDGINLVELGFNSGWAKIREYGHLQIIIKQLMPFHTNILLCPKIYWLRKS